MASNDLTTRKDARNSLKTLLQTITEFQRVYDHEPVSLAGESPVATIQSASQYPQFQTSVNSESHQFIIEVYVNRADADAAEDLLDDLALSIAEKVRSWHNAFFFQPSQAFYELQDSISYRGEVHFVQVDWE